MNPWMRNLLCGGGGGGGGPVLPPAGRTMLANLKSSLILDEGTGDPTWSRATKAWGFNELGYLEELASGCAFFGGARLVRNTVRTKSEDFSNAPWVKTNLTVTGTNVLVCSNSTADNSLNQATDTNFPTIAGQYFRYSIRAKRVSGGVSFVQIGGSSASFGATAFCTFSLTDGTYAAQTGVTASVTQISSDTYDFSVRLLCTTTTTNADVFYVSMQNGLSDTRKQLFVGDGVKSFELLRAWSVDVTNYDASYVPEYVSVGVVSSPYHGAGIDGAKYFETDWQGAPIAAANLLKVRREVSAVNNLLYSRDLSNAAWSTKTNITAAKTATGLDGIANTATTLTATAADATILQPTSGIASAARCASAYVKRRTGTGTISFTQDGTNWTDITSQINSSTWSRVQITSTLANPSVGFKIGTSGDAIDVDCVQNEAGTVATSPIVTTTATITRNADSLTYQTAGNIDFAVGTFYCEAQFASSLTTRQAALIGADGLVYLNAGDANTSFKTYDGTTIVTKSGLSDISTAKRKRVVSWGPTGLTVTGDGLAPTSGAFDGSFGSGATIEIKQNINGYIGPVAIYNYQMTDAELQAITA